MIGALGRVPSRVDARTLKLSSYLAPRDYQAPPPAYDWTGPDRYSWYRNNELGCCTITSIAHLVQCHAFRHGEVCTITDADIERGYRAVSGYDGTPATDRGAQIIDALVWAKREGWIEAFVRVDVADPVEVRAAIFLLGGMIVGADLPRRIIEQGTTWTLPPVAERVLQDAPRSLGGHAYDWLGYDRLALRALPWITPTTQSNGHAGLYVDEGWALLMPGWARDGRLAPNGFNIERLREDLAAIGRR